MANRKRRILGVKVKGSDGEVATLEVDARPTAVPELWIHRRVTPYPGKRHWTVTHAPTGFSAYHARSLAEAATYARSVASVSWDFTDKAPRPVVDAHVAALVSLGALEAA